MTALALIPAPARTSSRCMVCRRLIEDPESMARGVGPVCWDRLYGPSVRSSSVRDGSPGAGQLDMFDLIQPVTWAAVAVLWPDGTAVTWTAPWDCGDMTQAGTVLPAWRCPHCGAVELSASLLRSVHGVAEDRPESWDQTRPGAWSSCWAQQLAARQAEAAAERAARGGGR